MMTLPCRRVSVAIVTPLKSKCSRDSRPQKAPLHIKGFDLAELREESGAMLMQMSARSKNQSGNKSLLASGTKVKEGVKSLFKSVKSIFN